ncbi:alpha-N-arabinofuranosidase [Gynurincola endophyticus]|uniref:alpha-N-arabinofuranosidase n=1 Tax=Gynurincola endophyticus TaxID=2479004 RepID=UPI001F40EB1B|nr:alpha-L-arabinofuranosidase C-terminal domain-containing protein [Gynurincola endophyticus]
MSVAQTSIVLAEPAKQIKISKHIYGHFAEHLGRCIYDGFYVGEKSTIPNTAGVRNDIIEALKKLNIPNLRWPGGCFADTYHWKDGVGPKENRPTIVNTWWGGVTEDNSFGTHDFLNLCEILGAEPYLSANVGSGVVQELIDWIQYTNFGGESPMSKWRRENGRAQPWNVKYWGVGNEAWGCGGHMTPEFYANIYRQYATYMNGWSGMPLYKIASGASSNDYNWTEVLMKNIPHNMVDALALHHYSVIDWSDKGPATGFSEKHYFATLEQAWMMDSLIIKHGAVMDKYDPKNKVKLVVDEWGGWYDVEPGSNPGFLYQQNTIRDAMIAGMTLNIFNNHADRVVMANLAQAVNVLQAVVLTEGEKMILTPTYHVMEMYKVHQEGNLLRSKITTPDYQLDGKKIPVVSVSASKDSTGILTVTLTNLHPSKTQETSIDLGAAYKAYTGRVLAGSSIQDHNSFEQPQRVIPKLFKSAKLNGRELKLTIPAASVIVLQFEAK